MAVVTRRQAHAATKLHLDAGGRGGGGGEYVPSSSSRRTSSRANGSSRKPRQSLALHGSCLVLYLYIWSILFRTSPPGANEFGWLLQYLTSFSFLIQTCILMSSFSESVYCLVQARTSQPSSSKLQEKKARMISSWMAWNDDFTLAIFPAAVIVDIAFYTLFYGLGSSAMLRSQTRSDPIVSTTQHVANGIIAFLDITLVRRRSDEKRAKRICFVFALSYQLWSLLCRYMNGHFPYPFLTRLSVRNYVIFIAVFISLFFVFFEIGKVIARIADSYWTSSEAKRGARGSKKRAQ